MINRDASLNFLGDNIILSENGVFGIVLSENITTAERYARERSRLINERLTKHRLQTATGIVYKDKYYLAVDGVCYVADSRYKFSGKDDVDNSFNYEWWYWDNIPAVVFSEVNGKLLFGTSKGSVCEFDDEYCDRELHSLQDGQYSYNSTTGVFTISSSEKDFIHENTVISFDVDKRVVLESDGTAQDSFNIPDNVINTFYEGMRLYCKVWYTYPSAYHYMYVMDLDVENRTCKLSYD